MKKLIMSALVAVGSAVCLHAADGDSFEWQGLKYTVLSEADKTCEVAENDRKLAGDVVIPSKATDESTATEYTVTALGRRAFYANGAMTSISIPETVTAIKYDAISQTTALSKLVIPNTVTEIEEHAVFGNWGLTSVTISSGVRELKRESFSGNLYLTRIVIPEGVEVIGPEVFNYCSGVTRLKISSTVKSIGKMAFSGQRKLKEVSIPANVKELGDEAFSYCVKLADVTFEESTENLKMGINVFGQGVYLNTADDPVAKIETLTILRPYSCVSTVPNEMPFARQPNLGYVILGENVSALPANTFAGSDNLVSVYVQGDRVLSANSSAFTNAAYSKATLTVPSNLLEAYKANATWSRFLNMAAGPESGIEDIEADGAGKAVVGIYDLNGRRVSGAAAPGLYIIRHVDGTATKRLVKDGFMAE